MPTHTAYAVPMGMLFTAWLKPSMLTASAARKMIVGSGLVKPSARSSGYLARGARINGVNVYLNQVEERVRFKRWFFGCLHMDKTMSKQHIAVFSRVVPVHEPHHKKK